MKSFLRTAFAVVILGFAGWYLIAHRTAFTIILSFDWLYLPVLFGITVLSIAINGLVLVIIVQAFDVRLNWTEWYGLTAISGMGNYAPIPQAGPAVRGVYLKNVHGLALSAYAATVVAVYIIALAVQGAVGLAGVTVFELTGVSAAWPLWVIFTVCMAAGLLFLPLPDISTKLSGLAGFQEGFQKVRHRKVLPAILILQLGQIILAAVNLWLAFAAVQIPTGFATCVLLSTMVLCSGIFNVTPGNIGVAESAAWFTASLLGQDADLAVVAYTILRAVSAITLFTLGPIFTILLTGRKSIRSVRH